MLNAEQMSLVATDTAGDRDATRRAPRYNPLTWLHLAVQARRATESRSPFTDERFRVSAVVTYTCRRAVRWLSGRKRRFAKPLYGLKPVPRVRIPASPPISLRSLALRQGFGGQSASGFTSANRPNPCLTANFAPLIGAASGLRWSVGLRFHLGQQTESVPHVHSFWDTPRVLNV